MLRKKIGQQIPNFSQITHLDNPLNSDGRSAVISELFNFEVTNHQHTCMMAMMMVRVISCLSVLLPISVVSLGNLCRFHV